MTEIRKALLQVDHSKTEFPLNDIKEFSSYVTGNTLHPHYIESCENRTESTNTLCRQNAEFYYGQVGGTYSNLWTLNGYVRDAFPIDLRCSVWFTYQLKFYMWCMYCPPHRLWLDHSKAVVVMKLHIMNFSNILLFHAWPLGPKILVSNLFPNILDQKYTKAQGKLLFL